MHWSPWHVVPGGHAHDEQVPLTHWFPPHWVLSKQATHVQLCSFRYGVAPEQVTPGHAAASHEPLSGLHRLLAVSHVVPCGQPPSHRSKQRALLPSWPQSVPAAHSPGAHSSHSALGALHDPFGLHTWSLGQPSTKQPWHRPLTGAQNFSGDEVSWMHENPFGQSVGSWQL